MTTDESIETFNLGLLTDDDMDIAVAKGLKKGIYIVPGHTGKGWFHYMIARASSVVFMRGEGNFIAIGFGDRADLVLESQKTLGFLVRIGNEDKT